MLLMVNGAVPVSCKVAFCGALEEPTGCDPKERLEGDRLAAGAATVPVPLSATVWGLPLASSVTVTLPVREPGADGVNVTEIVQVELGASVAGAVGQSFASVKSPAFAPATPMLPIVSGALPVFLSVELLLALVVPPVWAAKPRLPGVRETAGPAV